MSEVRCILDAKALLGECPVWSAEEQALYWVDSMRPALHRLDPATGATFAWPMPEPIGSFGLCQGGGAVVALKSGLYRFDLETGRRAFLAHPEPNRTGNRFGDGKVSPDGRFWVGTMDGAGMRRPTGALYRLDPDGACRRIVDGLIVSTGLAWSKDGRAMFHADSKAQRIWAYDYDPGAGEIGNRREVARPSEADGRPLGAATDVEGYYWSAGVSAGVLNRWSPDGRLDRRIELPCAAPTGLCFGGPGLQAIFVTSCRHGVSDQGLAAKPLSGGIFAVRVGVPGVPVARFKG